MLILAFQAVAQYRVKTDFFFFHICAEMPPLYIENIKLKNLPFNFVSL